MFHAHVNPIRWEILGACSCLVTDSLVFLEVMKAIISGLAESKMVGAHSVGTYCPNSPSSVSHVLPLSTGQQIRSLGDGSYVTTRCTSHMTIMPEPKVKGKLSKLRDPTHRQLFTEIEET